MISLLNLSFCLGYDQTYVKLRKCRNLEQKILDVRATSLRQMKSIHCLNQIRRIRGLVGSNKV